MSKKRKKYRPKRYSPIAETDYTREGFIAGIIGEAIKRAVEALTKGEIYICGNPKCKATIHVWEGERIPKFCGNCGSEIDWSIPTIPTIPKRVYPKCLE